MTPRRQAIQERRRRVADLHRDCYSNAQIAEITGLAIHLVKSDLTAMGVSTKAEHQRMLTRAVRLMRSGRPLFEVSASCAIPLSTLVRIAAEQGI